MIRAACLQALVLTVAGVLPAAGQVLAPSDLVAWWRAEGNANDSVGGNHGTLLGGTGFATGAVGQAFQKVPFLRGLSCLLDSINGRPEK